MRLTYYLSERDYGAALRELAALWELRWVARGAMAVEALDALFAGERASSGERAA